MLALVLCWEPLSEWLPLKLFPQYHLEAGEVCYCRNGGVTGGIDRAPLTGIILVLETTDNYQLILPMIINRSWRNTISTIYRWETAILVILARTLAKQEAEQLARSKAASARENT
ncbi:chloride channel protein [Shigella sonnei]